MGYNAEKRARILKEAKKRRMRRKLRAPRSQEFRDKMREANQGRVRPPADREAIASGLKGRSLSLLHRMNISEALTGRGRPQEVKDKIAKKLKGTKRPDVVKRRIRASMKQYWDEKKALGH